MAIILASRTVRLTTKDRKISFGKATNIFGFFKPIAQWVGGLITGILNFFKIDLVTIFQLLYQQFIQVWNFDWNQSDAALSSAIDANNLQVIAVAGQATGGSLAWLVCSGLGVAAEAKIPILRGRVAVQLAKEGGQFAKQALRNLLNTAARAAASNAALSAFKDIRRWLKSDSPLAVAVAQYLFGSNYQNMKDFWGKPGGEPWTIGQALEEKVQSIPNAGIRVFTENLLDEFGDELTDCLFEAVYLIQQAYDDQAAVRDYGSGNTWDTSDIILDVKPNTQTNEIVRVTAPTIVLAKQQIASTLGQARLLGNRDVGFVVGQPAQDFLSTNPLRRQIVFTYRNVQRPPWKDAQNRVAKTVTITVPEPKIGLSWNELKLLAKPFAWGKYRAKADLANGRQIIVNGASPAEAKSTLMNFHSLCSIDIVSINITEENYKKNLGLIKDATQVFVQEATLLVRKDNLGIGTQYINGEQLLDQVQQIILWTDTEPPGLGVLL